LSFSIFHLSLICAKSDKWKMEKGKTSMKAKSMVRLSAAVMGLAAIVFFHSSLRAHQTDKAVRSAWDGVYTKEQVKRGEGLYAQHCSSCHGPDLAGNDEAAPLTGPAFLANWDGLSVGDLSERVRVSMPPNNLGKLSRQQIVDILSYVLSVNSFPAGKTELDPKAELLKQVRIEATKPRAGSGHIQRQQRKFSSALFAPLGRKCGLA
jgi:mono/diheme cytochrome c family protein